MSTTKVLHVIARMNVGGTARYVGDLVANIPGSELATGYVQGLEIEDQIVSKLHVHRIPHLGRRIDPRNDFRAWLELRRLIRELKPDVVHTHTFKAGLIGRLVSGSHKRVHTFHGHLFEDPSFSGLQKGIISIVERVLAKKTDLLVSVGTRVGEEIREQGIGKKNTWVSISPGINPIHTIPKSIAREKLSLPKDELLVGWMARVTAVKNPDLLLQVASKLPQITFVLAGGGDMLEEITIRAPKNVFVIGWTDAPTFWSAVDIGLSTSDNEGMPIALIEAQFSGVPVIATDVGSNNEVILSHISGLVVRKSVDDVVSALTELAINPQERQLMSENAISHARKEFAMATLISAHTKMYASLTND